MRISLPEIHNYGYVGCAVFILITLICLILYDKEIFYLKSSEENASENQADQPLTTLEIKEFSPKEMKEYRSVDFWLLHKDGMQNKVDIVENQSTTLSVNENTTTTKLSENDFTIVGGKVQ